MVLQGHETTLPVTLADMVYHTRCVARGSKRAFLVADIFRERSRYIGVELWDRAGRLIYYEDRQKAR